MIRTYTRRQWGMTTVGSLLAWGGMRSSSPTQVIEPSLQACLRDRRDWVIVHDLKEHQLLCSQPLSAFASPTVAPGSLMKIFTAATALKAGVTTATRPLVCPGWHDFPPPLGRLSCWDPRGHGTLTLAAALAHSCNVHFYQLGALLGSQRLLQRFHAWGLGTEQVMGTAPLLATGQDPTFTVLPLALLAALIRVTRRDPSYPQPVWDVIHQGLAEAVIHGTGQGLVPQGFPHAVAAKTGTIRGTTGSFQGWIGSFWPLVQPRWVMLLFIHQGRAYAEGIPAGQRVLQWVESTRSTDP